MENYFPISKAFFSAAFTSTPCFLAEPVIAFSVLGIVTKEDGNSFAIIIGTFSSFTSLSLPKVPAALSCLGYSLSQSTERIPSAVAPATVPKDLGRVALSASFPFSEYSTDLFG